MILNRYGFLRQLIYLFTVVLSVALWVPGQSLTVPHVLHCTKVLHEKSPHHLFSKRPIKTIFTRFNFTKVVLYVLENADIVTSIYSFTKYSVG